MNKKTPFIIIAWFILGFASLTLANYGVKTVIYSKAQPKENQNTIPANLLAKGLINTQLSIGLQQLNRVAPDQAVILLKELQDLALTNIINTLEVSKDKWATLNSYLQASDQAIIQWNFLLWDLNQQALYLKGNIDNCLIEKGVADKEYFDGLNDFNQEVMDTALQDSKKADACASENRIEYNALIEIIKRISYYHQILAGKFDYLSEKEDLIITHFDLIKEDLVRELLNIKITLENL